MFSYETKASMPFILMRRMHLWCLIMKQKEIIMWILVYPNWKMNFNSKNGRKRNISYETKAWISFIPARRMHLCCLIVKRKKIITWNHVCQNRPMNIISKNFRRKVFLVKPKRQFIYPSVQNEFVVPNH